MGKGKGGDGCCSACCVVTLILIGVSFLGIGFLGGGIAVLVVFKIERHSNIKKVDDAVIAWNSSSALTGWRQFQNAKAYATLTPGNPNCSTTTVSLSSSSCPYNVYVDEALRFQSVKQLAFCVTVPYSTFVSCDMRVTFQVEQGGSNTTLPSLPDLVTTSGYKQVRIKMMEIRGPNKCDGKKRCAGSNFNSCSSKCANAFGGTLSCSDYTCTANVAVNDLTVKVTSKSGSYVADDAGPVFSKGGAGGNVLPTGFSWVWYPVSTSTAPYWEYDGLGFHGAPASMRLTLRSSADPWLTYLAATGGSGYFDQPLPILGGALVGIGGLIMLGVLITAGLFAHARSVARRYPDRPSGCYSGCLWGMGRGLFGPRHTPTVAMAPQAPGMQVYPPVAQPMPGAQPYPYGYAPQPGMAAPAPAVGYYGYPPPVPGAPGYPQQQPMQPMQPGQQPLPYPAAYYPPPQLPQQQQQQAPLKPT